MSKRDWKLFLEDILESIEWIEDFIKGMDAESFACDRKTVDAVVRNFEIIGEAAKSIPVDIRERHQGVDWSGMIGLRNRIAHEYFGLSLPIIWKIAVDDLPKLKNEIIRIEE
uniref:DUF86 domain-containing protein n=1 Tax=Chlorobium phaeobacteroides (strain BS1) TaxID=331678 RepID=B3EM18_CHLPB